jgi:hypothetical protein
MAMGMKETRKVWVSLLLEIEAGKEKKCAGKKEKNRRRQQQKQCRGQPAEQGWLGRFRGKKKEKNVSGQHQRPWRTAAAAAGGSDGSFRWVFQMGLSDGLFRWFGWMVWPDGFRQQQQQGGVSVFFRSSCLQQKHSAGAAGTRGRTAGDFDERDALKAQEENQEEREDWVQREQAVGGEDKIGGRMPWVRQMAVSDVQSEKESI